VYVVRGRSSMRGLACEQADMWRDAGDDISALQRRWRDRDRRWQDASRLQAFTNPTALKETMDEVFSPAGGWRVGPRPESARLIGILAHRVLEGWDFSLAVEKLSDRVKTVCRHGLAPESADGAEQIADELQDLFRTFGNSKPYADLRRATILGREVPFAFPWAGTRHEARDTGLVEIESPAHRLAPRASQPAPGACVMEGLIDLVYRLDGKVWVADYKTDQVAVDELQSRVADYDLQARIYREAVRRSLGIDRVGFQFIFLRQGTAVSIL
jgi:ATP-dependent helicase/nuclease subunit A